MSSLATDLATTTTVERAAAGDEVAFAGIVATHRIPDRACSHHVMSAVRDPWHS
jgi:hypothetical protein